MAYSRLINFEEIVLDHLSHLIVQSQGEEQPEITPTAVLQNLPVARTAANTSISNRFVPLLPGVCVVAVIMAISQMIDVMQDSPLRFFLVGLMVATLLGWIVGARFFKPLYSRFLRWLVTLEYGRTLSDEGDAAWKRAWRKVLAVGLLIVLILAGVANMPNMLRMTYNKRMGAAFSDGYFLEQPGLKCVVHNYNPGNGLTYEYFLLPAQLRASSPREAGFVIEIEKNGTNRQGRDIYYLKWFSCKTGEEIYSEVFESSADIHWLITMDSQPVQTYRMLLEKEYGLQSTV